MIKTCFSICVILLLSLTVMAENTHKAEVFASYSYGGNGFNGLMFSIVGNLN